jgi:predicted GNAT superfamily acetyltransferase
MSDIIIRDLATHEEYAAAEAIQRTTWGMPDLEIIPGHALHAMQHSGAALLGAFDGPQLVGFTFGVLSTQDTPNRIDQVAAARLKMYSVIAGVLPAYQHQNVGYRLKMAQRDFCLRVGVRLITWTYDPLESRNGLFNIGKLGAVCHNYLRHFHGDMSGLNAGLPTDRFEVEWWVTSHRAEARATRKWRPLRREGLLAGGALLVNEATFDAAGLPVPPPNTVSRPSNLMLVEIPANFQAIKRQELALAQRWRAHTRDIFEALFDSGFLVTDFVTQDDEAGRPRSYYLLTHGDS